MKSLFKLSILLNALFFITACGEAPKGEKTTATEAIEVKPDNTDGAKDYTVDITGSKIYWEGTKLMGEGHNGTISLQSGNISVKKGKITGGNFTIDMQSIANTDIEDEGEKADLVAHLSNGDFFDVTAHKTATFEITKIELASDNPKATHSATGNLTIKNISKSITIPVNVGMSAKAVTIKSLDFTINRTEWDVKFHSGIVGTAKDRIINDEVGMRLVIEAAVK